MGDTTIFALSSGSVPSGIAVVRISGPRTRFVLETITGGVPRPRQASLKEICYPGSNRVIDTGIVLYFPGPKSFTGEDSGEFQIHGGPAVVSALFDALASIDNVIAAEAGEFSRRAFENGRLDLVELEGLSDLVVSRTEQQRLLAVASASGLHSRLYGGWRNSLLDARASIEAGLDFTDEEDVPGFVASDIFDNVNLIIGEITKHLDDRNSGEIIRRGFRIALMGPPNSGKSSLMNALAKRDVSIVSDIEGTTRDVVEVGLDISGFEVVVSDTAGIRNTVEEIESIGIDRAIEAGRNSDLVIWLHPADNADIKPVIPDGFDMNKVMVVHSKSDLIDQNKFEIDYLAISVRQGSGLNRLVDDIGMRVCSRLDSGDDLLVIRERHRSALNQAVSDLMSAVSDTAIQDEIFSEYLRLASNSIGRIVGKIDVEEILGEIFSKFCIGK